MIAYHFAATQRPGRRLLAVSLASTALLISGCSNLISTAPVSNPVSAAAGVSGRVHGGNQPVAGATVNLYFASQTGTAAPATLVATTTTSDDNTGSFNFNKLADGLPNSGTTNSFSCPTTGGTPYVYVIARGGNTLNTHDPSVNNTAAAFIAPMGLCDAITASTFVYMSEAVTAATMAAVHSYMNEATADIGADGILAAYDGLQNAFNTVSNMVNLSTGQTIATVPLTGPTSGITITASPEQAKLNQVANILSSCINNATSAASACVTLFANAVPPASASTTSTPNASFGAPTDVLQAAYYMFTNPTDSNTTNLNNLYNLSSAAGAPYQPTLSAVPTDWLIGIQYVSSGNCSTSGGFVSFPYDLNVDETGNIWVANAVPGSGSLAELSPTGAPMVCLPLTGSSRGATIDSAGNVWIGDFEKNVIYRYTPNPGGTPSTLAFPTTTAPFALAADGTGNIYYSTVTSGSPSVWIITGGSTAGAAVTPTEISNTVGATPARILVDGNGAIWASTRNTYVSRIAPAAPGTTNYLNGYSTVQFTTPSPSYGIAANSGTNSPNGIYVSIQNPINQLDLLTGSGSNYVPAANFPTASGAAGLNTPNAIAVDGASNVWSANDGTDSGTATPSVPQSLVSEFAASGRSLSPDAVVSSGVQVSGGYQKASSYFVNGRTIAVDEAGNIWVGRDGSNQLSEIVGGGVPIFQPFALGLNKGRFQSIP